MFEAALGRSCLLADRCQRNDLKKQFGDAVTSTHGDKASHRFQFNEFDIRACSADATELTVNAIALTVSVCVTALKKAVYACSSEDCVSNSSSGLSLSMAAISAYCTPPS
jgi:hypothetical protein